MSLLGGEDVTNYASSFCGSSVVAGFLPRKVYAILADEDCFLSGIGVSNFVVCCSL